MTRADLAIVPARAGSQGLAGKNEAVLDGLPLWRRAAEQGRRLADRVVVTTDIAHVLDAGVAGIEIVARPPKLATHDAPMDGVLLHACRASGADRGTVVLLQPTSPLRADADIAAAVRLHGEGIYDLVMTVTRTGSHPLKYGFLDGSRFEPVARPDYCFANRQALPPLYRPNGAVYVFEAAWFRLNGGLATSSIGAVEMPAARSADVDTSSDLEAVRAALAGRT